MRLVIATSIIFILGITQSVRAQEPPYPAGISRLDMKAGDAFNILVWYPASKKGAPWRIGPFPISAAKDAPLAEGRFPVVLLSHGGGRSGGSPLILRDLSSSLARNGFIVIAPFHGKAPFLKRGFQMKAALDVVAATPRFSSSLDSEEVAIVGFSLGSAVALELAGATPDFKQLEGYCQANPSDKLSCSGGPSATKQANESAPARTAPAMRDFPRLPSLKALVLLDPFTVLFTSDSIATIDQPTLAFRPDGSPLGKRNLEVLQANLPKPPETQNVQGGHFIFADICPDVLVDEAPIVCKDAPGIDRSAAHQVIEVETAAFLRKHLRSNGQ